MSATIQILSGLGDKGPAAIVVEAQGKRLLLDAGGALHPGEPVTWARGLAVDAVLISHDHVDHIGGVVELPAQIPLYCTPLVAKALPPQRAWQPLPYRGRLDVEGIAVTTGQAGHSLGGVWLHLDVAGGIFYSGDACFESRLFPFDAPPTRPHGAARCLLWPLRPAPSAVHPRHWQGVGPPFGAAGTGNGACPGNGAMALGRGGPTPPSFGDRSDHSR